MHQARVVRRQQAAARLREGVEDGAGVARAIEPRAQRLALDELHGDEQAHLAGADVVDGDDVGVRQPRQRLRLALQARAHRRRVVGAIGAQHLERDGAVELRIVRAVDHAHAALAEELQHPIAAELGPRRQDRHLGARAAVGRGVARRRQRLQSTATARALGQVLLDGAALARVGRLEEALQIFAGEVTHEVGTRA